MNEERIAGSPSWSDPRGQVMKTPDDVAAMVRLKACGWGIKRIARELGCRLLKQSDNLYSSGSAQVPALTRYRVNQRIPAPSRNEQDRAARASRFKGTMGRRRIVETERNWRLRCQSLPQQGIE
jgi:hypothetical protein